MKILRIYKFTYKMTKNKIRLKKYLDFILKMVK